MREEFRHLGEPSSDVPVDCRPHQVLGYRTSAEVYLERKSEEMIAGN